MESMKLVVPNFQKFIISIIIVIIVCLYMVCLWVYRLTSVMPCIQRSEGSVQESIVSVCYGICG